MPGPETACKSSAASKTNSINLARVKAFIPQPSRSAAGDFCEHVVRPTNFTPQKQQQNRSRRAHSSRLSAGSSRSATSHCTRSLFCHLSLKGKRPMRRILMQQQMLQSNQFRREQDCSPRRVRLKKKIPSAT